MWPFLLLGYLVYKENAKKKVPAPTDTAASSQLPANYNSAESYVADAAKLAEMDADAFTHGGGSEW